MGRGAELLVPRAGDGTVTYFAWVTDIPITPNNLMTLMRGARAHWTIENEAFNTLKNQGDHFAHNFGHGHQHLSTVFMHLMILALADRSDPATLLPTVQAALTAAKSKTLFWRQLRTRFDLRLIPDGETLDRSIITPPRLPLGADTS